MLYISNHLFLQLNDLLKGSLWWLNEITSSRLFKSGKLFHNAIHSFIFTYRELFSYKERFLMQSYLWPCFRKNFYSWKRPVAPNSSVSSVAQSYPTLCNPVVCRMPSFPVHHQLLKLAQTHVHWVSDAFPSISACNWEQNVYAKNDYFNIEIQIFSSYAVWGIECNSYI